MLVTERIPTFAPRLVELVHIAREQGSLDPGTCHFNVARALHQAGINVRYLGLVRAHCRDEYTRTVCLIEMCARVVKQQLRQRMRQRMQQLQFPLGMAWRTWVLSDKG